MLIQSLTLFCNKGIGGVRNLKKKSNLNALSIHYKKLFIKRKKNQLIFEIQLVL